MSNSCCFITSNSRKYFPGLKWNAKRGGTLLQQEKRGGSPSNPVKKQVCLWSLCEKHVFLLGFFFWATMGHLGSLGRLTTVCTPPGEGRFSQRRGSLGAPALFFGRKCQVECQIYVRSMSVGDHSKNLEDSTLCVFFFKARRCEQP